MEKNCLKKGLYLRNEYNDDLDIDMLVTELPVLKTFFKDIEVVCFDDIIKHFRNFPTETKIIPNLALLSCYF